jgi:hypothetical protein
MSRRSFSELRSTVVAVTVGTTGRVTFPIENGSVETVFVRGLTELPPQPPCPA